MPELDKKSQFDFLNNDVILKSFPLILKVFSDSAIFVGLKEAGKVINFAELRKMAVEYVDTLERKCNGGN